MTKPKTTPHRYVGNPGYLYDLEAGVIVAEPGVVAVGQRADEVVSVRLPGGGDDLVVGGLQPAVADVVLDRGREERRILHHNNLK